MSRRKSAAKGELNDLHAYIAKFFTHELRKSLPPELGGYEDELEEELDEDGEPTGRMVKPFRMPISDSKVGHILKFLADNDITTEPDDPALAALKGEFADDFEARREAAAELLTNQTVEQAEQASWLK